MPAALESSRPAADDEQRQVVARVPLAVGNARAVQDRHVIQKRAVAVGRRPKLRQILREQLRVIAIDLRHVRDELRSVVVVRQRMVRFGHADLRVRPGALLLADHERDDARQVGLKRQELQVEHQRQVVFEDRRHALRLFDRRQLDVALLLGSLNAPLDVANRLGVFLDLDLVLRTERPSSGSPACPTPSRECSCAAAIALRAPAAPCCRYRQTASRTPPAGCTPSAAAASGCATRCVCV